MPILSDRIGRLRDTWTDGKAVWSHDTADYRVDEVSVYTTLTPARFDGLLGAERAVVRSRRYFTGDQPVLLAVSYIPLDLAEGTAIQLADSGPGGTYARLAGKGHAPARFREDVRMRMPSERESERLALRFGTPVAEITRTAWDSGGRVVEVTVMTADPGAFALRYEWDGGGTTFSGGS